MAWTEAFKSPSISMEDYDLRIRFAAEFIFDRDPVLALLRLGFNIDFSKNYGEILLNDPVVQRYLSNWDKTLHERINNRDPEVLALLTAHLYRESIESPSHIARVNALGKLMEIAGMSGKTEEPLDNRAIEITVRHERD